MNIKKYYQMVFLLVKNESGISKKWIPEKSSQVHILLYLFIYFFFGLILQAPFTPHLLK